MKPLLTLTLVAALACASTACDRFSNSASVFHNRDITGVDYGKGFTLTDHNGQVRKLEDFRGKVVVMFFGYVQCPDVCPTTMAEMATVMNELGPAGNEVQVLFVTVDPERDTQQLLAEYVPAFDKRFLGLHGTPEQIDQVAREFKVFYAKGKGGTPESYTVDHTAGSYVFDRDGRLRLFVRHGEGAGLIAHDVRQLLK